jgi:hypothetical protein
MMHSAIQMDLLAQFRAAILSTSTSLPSWTRLWMPVKWTSSYQLPSNRNYHWYEVRVVTAYLRTFLTYGASHGIGISIISICVTWMRYWYYLDSRSCTTIWEDPTNDGIHIYIWEFGWKLEGFRRRFGNTVCSQTVSLLLRWQRWR